MVMADRAEYRQTFMLDKGLYNKPQDEVRAAYPEFGDAVAFGSRSTTTPLTTHHLPLT